MPDPTKLNQNITTPTTAPVGMPPTGVTAPPTAQKPSDQTPKKARDQRASVQNHLMFSEIKDGIVVMRDGSLRMVIVCSPLNFDLKSSREQDAIEFAYQSFLNGLHFPIQIIVRSRKLDLDNYLENLEKLQADQENELLAGLMEDYIYNIRGLLTEVNIMKKEFYVIVPLFVTQISRDNLMTKLQKLLKPNQDVSQTTTQFEERKRDLIQRTNMVSQGLAQLGVRAAVLSTQELIELFYSAYNIDESQNQSLINVSDITSPVITQGRRQAATRVSDKEIPEPDDLFSAAAKQESASSVTQDTKTGSHKTEEQK